VGEKKALTLSLCAKTLKRFDPSLRYAAPAQPVPLDRSTGFNEARLARGFACKLRELRQRCCSSSETQTQCLPETGNHHGQGDARWNLTFGQQRVKRVPNRF